MSRIGRSQVAGWYHADGHAFVAGAGVAADGYEYGGQPDRGHQGDKGPVPVVEEGYAGDDDVDE